MPSDAARRRLGLIAGSGRLPVEIASALQAQGEDFFVVLIEGEAEPEPIFTDRDHQVMAIEDFGRLAPTLHKAKVGRVVMAGGVSRRPRIRAVRWHRSLLASLPAILRGLRSGDDRVLRAVIGYLERHGIEVIGAQDVIPDLLASHGPLTSGRPGAGDLKDIEAAVIAARAIGRLDIGQAAVAIGGRVIALEGIEGTAGLLQRVADMRDHPRLAGRAGGVLVKCAKPGQELRADLPSIGPDTISAAFAAGLHGIAVDAGRSFVLDAGTTFATAERHGMFILGIREAETR